MPAKSATKDTGAKKPKYADEENVFDVDPSFVARFDFVQLTLKERIWTIKLEIRQKLPEIFNKYDVEFVLDTDPYDENIERAEEALRKAENGDPTLDDTKQKNVDHARKRLVDANNALDAARKKYRPIRFLTLTEQVSYKHGRTVMVMQIAADVVSQIDKAKLDLMPYSGEVSNVYMCRMYRHLDSEAL